MEQEKINKLYKKIEDKYPSKNFGVVDVVRKVKRVVVGEYPNRKVIDYIDGGWQMELPHQCDEWIIGTVKEAEEFMKNLKEAIDYCKK